VGDLAQFMVGQGLTTAAEVRAQAADLPFPDSVVGFLQGKLGTPPGGWDADPQLAAVRLAVLGARKLEPIASGTTAAASMPAYDFDKTKAELKEAYGSISADDVLSHAMYPQVFKDWQKFKGSYGDLESMPTHVFLRPLQVGDEVEVELTPGRRKYVQLASIGPIADGQGGATTRLITFNVNGERWFIRVSDDAAVAAATSSGAAREKSPGGPGDIGAPMPGAIVGVKTEEGGKVKKGDTLFVLSAMKMETAITAPCDGVAQRITVGEGDTVDVDDLLAVIKEE
jgi:pyruvate carboxylase